MPKMEKVYLHNPSSEEISLISISATTAHFHASFFQNRVSTPPCFVSSSWINVTTLRLTRSAWRGLCSERMNCPLLIFIRTFWNRPPLINSLKVLSTCVRGSVVLSWRRFRKVTKTFIVLPSLLQLPAAS